MPLSIGILNLLQTENLQDEERLPITSPTSCYKIVTPFHVLAFALDLGTISSSENLFSLLLLQGNISLPVLPLSYYHYCVNWCLFLGSQSCTLNTLLVVLQ